MNTRDEIGKGSRFNGEVIMLDLGNSRTLQAHKQGEENHEKLARACKYAYPNRVPTTE